MMLKKRNVFVLLLSLLMTVASAQTAHVGQFCSPFDFPLLLSASFAELRPNHFHGGLDIKTNQKEGFPIHCIADGYVARILITHGGYGQALYINHPNGVTSVYGHVKAFDKRIEDYTRQYQREHESYNCDIYPEPGRFTYKKGEIIALSGNEGASAGPHLHMELRRTATNEYMDPLPYFKHLIKDTTAPRAKEVVFYPVKGEGVVNGQTTRQFVSVSSLNKGISAWGKVSFGLKANDYMDGTSNFYGVKHVRLLVDGKELYVCHTDSFLPNENRMINSLIDYDAVMRHHGYVMRTYKEPGNQLRMMQVGEERGILTINEERDYHLEYQLEDSYGNKSSYSFILKGIRQEIPLCEAKVGRQLYTHRGNVIQYPGFEMVIPRGFVYDDIHVNFAVESHLDEVSNTYILDNPYIPLHGYCPIALALKKMPVDTAKYYIEQQIGQKTYAVPARYDDGWLKARVNRIGSFKVAIDTVPPLVTPMGQTRWRQNPGSIRFRVKDNESGVASYKVKVDGQYAFFWMKWGTLVLQDARGIKPGVPHKVEIVVTDFCGNVTSKQIKF